MAGTTTPDSIAYWTTSPSDPASIVTESATQAASIQLALDKRQNYDYRWADSAERSVETGMNFGAQGFQVDTGEGYFFDGAIWKLWDKPVTTYTPTVTGTSIGSTGTNTAFWSMSSGRVFVEGNIVLGGAGISVGSTILTRPTTSITYPVNTPTGFLTLADTGVQTYTGQVMYESTSTVRFITINVGATYPTTVLLTSLIPFTWAAADYMTYSYSYVAA